MLKVKCYFLHLGWNVNRFEVIRYLRFHEILFITLWTLKTESQKHTKDKTDAKYQSKSFFAAAYSMAS